MHVDQPWHQRPITSVNGSRPSRCFDGFGNFFDLVALDQYAHAFGQILFPTVKDMCFGYQCCFDGLSFLLQETIAFLQVPKISSVFPEWYLVNYVIGSITKTAILKCRLDMMEGEI